MHVGTGVKERKAKLSLTFSIQFYAIQHTVRNENDERKKKKNIKTKWREKDMQTCLIRALRCLCKIPKKRHHQYHEENAFFPV